MNWRDKRVVILGLARQGTALARYLVAQGACVVASDMSKSADLSSLQDLTGRIEFVLGEHPLSLLDNCDMLCLSGGVPIDLPIVLAAKARGIPLSNDSQIFFDVCPAPIIGITGSAGKTTTTTLVGEMLREELRIENEELRKGGQNHGEPFLNSAFSILNSRSVWVGGNIGNPLISDIGAIKADDFVVMELSSFQLELMTRSPQIACITNITPNHLDRHGTMAAYTAAKKHIIDFQTEQDWQVLCADDPITRTLNTQAQTAWFSLNDEPQGVGAWMDEGGELRVRLPKMDGRRKTEDGLSVSGPPSPVDLSICHRRELQLMGAHNILNVLGASLVAGLAGASIEAIRKVATTFRGVPHRLQLISELNGARWYDDSIATAPERLMAALKCFDQKVILLCGGRDKYLPWGEAAQMMLDRCSHIILFGEMAPLVFDEVEKVMLSFYKAKRRDQEDGKPVAHKGVIVHVCGTMEDAVADAKKSASQGDVVLLSPGGTSYDAFKDFAERGDRFRELVTRQET